MKKTKATREKRAAKKKATKKGRKRKPRAKRKRFHPTSEDTEEITVQVGGKQVPLDEVVPPDRVWSAVTNPRALEHRTSPVVRSLIRGVQIRLWSDQAAVREHEQPYLSPEHWVLEHGFLWDYVPPPAGERRGLPKACYDTSRKAALRKRDPLTYVEGYAVGVGLRVLFAHAWNVTEDDQLVDLTLNQELVPDTWQYFGVRFNTAYVKQNDRVLIDAWLHEYPLLRVPGETEKAIRAAKTK